MTWLLAVVFRPLGTLIFFGSAALLAHAIRPLIPDGQWKQVLYDRTLRKRYPWRFCLLLFVSFYGTVWLVYLAVS